jgi:hypothetical protein
MKAKESRDGVVDQSHAAFINYPRIKILAGDIRRCQSRSAVAGAPHCMSLEGPSGAGKTTLIERYIDAYPREETPDGTRVPILYVQVPSPTTVKGMVSTILEDLGDPAAFKGTQTALDSRLVHLLQACEVELVILDDFHNLINSETVYMFSAVSNWLKALIKKSGIPFMVVGVDGKVEPILRANPELSRLFARRETLYPFAWDVNDKRTIEEFGKFVAHAERALGSPLTTQLPRMDLLYRIHYATGGIVNHIMALFRSAQEYACEAQSETIELLHMAQAFDKEVSKLMPDRANPFPRTLDRLVPAERLVVTAPTMEEDVYAILRNARSKSRKKKRDGLTAGNLLRAG